MPDFSINFDGTEFHPNCLSYSFSMGEAIKEVKLYKCDRCHNRKGTGAKILPVDSKTFCVDCQRTYKLIMYISEEA